MCVLSRRRGDIRAGTKWEAFSFQPRGQHDQMFGHQYTGSVRARVSKLSIKSKTAHILSWLGPMVSVTIT